MSERKYTADISGERFIVTHEPEQPEPWGVSSNTGYTEQETLDEALFWELVVGERRISEEQRASILADFNQ